MSALPARTGWDWLKQGVSLFRKQPAALTTLLFANILVSLFLSFVPVQNGQKTTLDPCPSFWKGKGSWMNPTAG